MAEMQVKITHSSEEITCCGIPWLVELRDDGKYVVKNLRHTSTPRSFASRTVDTRDRAFSLIYQYSPALAEAGRKMLLAEAELHAVLDEFAGVEVAAA